MVRSNWVCGKIDEAKLKEISARTDVNPFILKILLSRGIEDIQEINKILYGWKDLEYDPFLMRDMEKAVGIITSALDAGKKITVYGDYDCDGITSTAVLVKFLRSVNGNVDYYIPDRLTEGYGMSFESVQSILNSGTELIITVDCGIRSFEETELIKKLGADIIVTDHHQCGDTIPAADAVINPHRPDCGYPFKMLSGVGVVYKLIQAICSVRNLGKVYKKYVDLVSLGTIADVVSITDENKSIVSDGVEHINSTENIGLDILVKLSGINKYKITAQSFAFGLSPRINSAGRMGNAEIALQLILAEDKDTAKELAFLLDASNKQRQIVENRDLESAESMIEKEKKAEGPVIVIASENFHQGVAGIVAAKIAEKYGKPCVLLSVENKTMARGSARSVYGINIFEALKKCGDILEEYGGHELAAGMSLDISKIEAFESRLNDAVKNDEKAFPQFVRKADLILQPEEITEKNVFDLEKLEPYGYGNEMPVFMSENMTVESLKPMGEDGRHLKIFFRNGGVKTEGIAFNAKERAEEILCGEKYNVVYNLENNVWNGRVTPQMKIIDIFRTDLENADRSKE